MLVKCPICKKSYSKLGAHITRGHNMSVDEFRKKYGWTKKQMATDSYRDRMRKSHNENSAKALAKSRSKTYFKPGKELSDKMKGIWKERHDRAIQIPKKLSGKSTK